MRPSDMLISLVMFSIVIMGISIYLGGLYNANTQSAADLISENFSHFKRYINETSDFSKGMELQIKNATQEKNVIQVAWYSLTGSFSILTKMLDIPRLFTDITSGTASLLGLETELWWLPAAISSIIIIIVIFAVIKGIFRVDL